MIDLNSETILSLTDAAKMLGVSTCTLWRWRLRGVRGRRLESAALGGKIVTSVEAVQRFARQQGGGDAPTIRTPRQRERAIARAEQELAREGI